MNDFPEQETGKAKKRFRESFRETILFLPGTFRDCGFFDKSKTPDFLDKKVTANNIGNA